MRIVQNVSILCWLCLTATNQSKAFQVAMSDSLLQIAIQENDAEEVKKLLGDGANPDMMISEYMFLLVFEKMSELFFRAFF